jgi:hypothetical protein
MIRAGDVGSALVGGIESPLWPSFQYHWQCTSAISTTNGGICKPFDKSRDGFLQGAGGTLLYLADEETVRERGLKPKAVIRSIVAGAKVHTITAHDPSGDHQGLLMDRAIKNAGGRVIRVTRGAEPAWYDAALSVTRGANGNSTWALSHKKLEKLGIHASETAWVGTQFDAVLDNNATVDELFAQINDLLASLQVAKVPPGV